MKKNISLIIGLISLLINPIYSQSTFKEKIKNFDDICFCNLGLSHPMEIINLDNNLELLFALKSGRTKSELEYNGIKYTNSQLHLLEYSGLIEKRDSIYQTLIPILYEDETIKLRKKTKEIAKEIMPLINRNSELLLKTLKTQNLQKNSYSIYLSFVLDGLVWEILEQNNFIDATIITKTEPFWDGTFWMLEPKREFSCGTNSLSSGNYSIHENWSESALISVNNYSLFKELLNDYKEKGRVTKPEVLKEFTKNELFDKEGILQIPLIKADSTDVIYSQSMNIANKICNYLQNDIDFSVILADCQGLSKGDKITILYHEIMWDILDTMESIGQINKPIIFAEPEEAKPEDLRELIFIVKE
jgi:hypothetical protein